MQATTLEPAQASARSAPPAPTAPLPPAAATAPPADAMAASPGDLAAAVAPPRTAAEMAGLQARIAELRNALRAAQDRRSDLGRELRHADPYARSVLESQMTGLDNRVVQLQTDIAETQGLVRSAPPAVAVTSQPRREFLLVGPNGPSRNAIPVLLFLVLALQVLLLRRGRGRRRDAFASDAMLRDTAARLARVEHAVDAIAVEVERVSEGQRFVSRLLSERPPAQALPTVPPPRQYATPN